MKKLLTILVATIFGIFFENALALAQKKVLVIAHRGASGYLPDHTLQSYRLAMEMGADFIEVDLVSSKDGKLIARHEPNILTTTDVSQHPDFAERKKRKTIDGISEEGFFAEDFTEAELKRLNAVQPMKTRDQSFNGKFKIPTLEDVLKLIREFEKETGRKVGVYVETKHPTYFRDLGLALEEKIVHTLVAQQFIEPERIFIQSFEVSNLRDILLPLLTEKKLKIPLIQLLSDVSHQPYDFQKKGRKETYGDLTCATCLKTTVAKYAGGIGPWKGSSHMEKLIRDAHAAGLLVHPYTFRNEAPSVNRAFKSPQDEYQAFFKMGVDGVFSDFADTAILQRNLYFLRTPAQ